MNSVRFPVAVYEDERHGAFNDGILILTGQAGLELRLFAIGLATGCATLCGGVLALRIRSRFDLLAAFGGGAMLAVALTDLLPEALSVGAATYPPFALTVLTLAGFIVYLGFSRWRGGLGNRPWSRALGPASLVVHSLLDGVGIGVAFNVSAVAAIAVATAVLTHDLVDGANTVTLSFAGESSRVRAWSWLAADALAPLAGIGLSRFIAPSPGILAPLLALFAGFFLCIATGEFLIKDQAGKGFSSVIATALGAVAVIAVTLASALIAPISTLV